MERPTLARDASCGGGCAHAETLPRSVADRHRRVRWRARTRVVRRGDLGRPARHRANGCRSPSSRTPATAASSRESCSFEPFFDSLHSVAYRVRPLASGGNTISTSDSDCFRNPVKNDVLCRGFVSSISVSGSGLADRVSIHDTPDRASTCLSGDVVSHPMTAEVHLADGDDRLHVRQRPLQCREHLPERDRAGHRPPGAGLGVRRQRRRPPRGERVRRRDLRRLRAATRSLGSPERT